MALRPLGVTSKSEEIILQNGKTEKEKGKKELILHLHGYEGGKFFKVFRKPVSTKNTGVQRGGWTGTAGTCGPPEFWHVDIHTFG